MAVNTSEPIPAHSLKTGRIILCHVIEPAYPGLLFSLHALSVTQDMKNCQALVPKIVLFEAKIYFVIETRGHLTSCITHDTVAMQSQIEASSRLRG